METKIDERVRSIADQVKSSVTHSNDFLSVNVQTGELGIENKTHVIFRIDDTTLKVAHNTYKNNLPDGLTLELIEEFKKYNSDFEAGVLLGVGESTLELMKKNSEVVCSTIKVNSESGKEVSVYIGIHEDPDEILMNGSIFSFNSYNRFSDLPSNLAKSTQAKIVRQHLTDLYTKALCNAVK